jgi:hypothetical protein
MNQPTSGPGDSPITSASFELVEPIGQPGADSHDGAELRAPHATPDRRLHAVDFIGTNDAAEGVRLVVM